MFIRKLLLLIVIGSSCLFAKESKVEIQSERSHFSQTFSLGEDRYVIRYSSLPMHFQNASGKFIEIPENDDGSYRTLAISQLEYWSGDSFGSYVKIDSTTGGDSYEVSENDEVGFHENGELDGSVDAEIWRYYSIFDNSTITDPSEIGDIIYDSVVVKFDVGTSSFPSSEFGNIRIRAGLRAPDITFPEDFPDSASWSNLESFGDSIDFFNPGYNPSDDDFVFTYDTTSTMFSHIKAILGDSNSNLNFILRKDDESYTDNRDHYIDVHNTYIDLHYCDVDCLNDGMCWR